MRNTTYTCGLLEKMAAVRKATRCDKQQSALEERLREAACIGDLNTVKLLLEGSHVADVNSKNAVNGWLVYYANCGVAFSSIGLVGVLVLHLCKLLNSLHSGLTRPL